MIAKTINVHISEIRPGDTVIHTDGRIRTVCKSDIHRSQFMGISLFGDTYRLGTIPVKKLIITRIIANDNHIIAAI